MNWEIDVGSHCITLCKTGGHSPTQARDYTECRSLAFDGWELTYDTQDQVITIDSRLGNSGKPLHRVEHISAEGTLYLTDNSGSLSAAFAPNDFSARLFDVFRINEVRYVSPKRIYFMHAQAASGEKLDLLWVHSSAPVIIAEKNGCKRILSNKQRLTEKVFDLQIDHFLIDCAAAWAVAEYRREDYTSDHYTILYLKERSIFTPVNELAYYRRQNPLMTERGFSMAEAYRKHRGL